MLKQIIEATRLRPEFCASLLCVPVEEFKEWMDQKRPLPRFVIPELSSILGISAETLAKRPAARDTAALAPAIWFKLRAEELSDSDREIVALIRRLGFFLGQLEDVRGLQSSAAWEAVAQTVLKSIDRSAPPAEQARRAALSFREAMDLTHGQIGIGELIRPRLRQRGLLVIESPVPRSSLEGCAFNVGSGQYERPCVFANTFKSTWFRRNEIILHEVCHAIFDLENDPVPLDFKDQGGNGSTLPEVRARVFAQSVLAPKSVLVHYQNQLGLNWADLRADEIAQLMAKIHVEQSTLLRAALDADLISQDLFERYISYNCSTFLKQFSTHALSTREYLQKLAVPSAKWIAQNRNSTVGLRTLRLPVSYVQQVLDAARDGDISSGKAAEMLMMDRYTFEDRFGDLLPVEQAA